MINLVFNLTVRQSLEQAQYNLSPTMKYQTVTLGFSYAHVCAVFRVSHALLFFCFLSLTFITMQIPTRKWEFNAIL